MAAMPVTMSTTMLSSGSITTVERIATIGSSTDPWLPERGRPGPIASGWACRRAAAEKLRTISFVRSRSAGRGMGGHQMDHPRHLIAGRARPARGQDRLAGRKDLGLNEQIAEGRMGHDRPPGSSTRLQSSWSVPTSALTRERLVIVSRRTSTSSSGETAMSVWRSMPKSRRWNSARA